MSGNDGRDAYPSTTVTRPPIDAIRAEARALGKAIGLRLALEAVTREVERQRHRAGVAAKAGTPQEKARHEYTAGVLSELAEELAGRFRQ